MSPAKEGGQIPSFRGYRVAAVVKIEVKLLWNELTRASLLKGGPHSYVGDSSKTGEKRLDMLN